MRLYGKPKQKERGCKNLIGDHDFGLVNLRRSWAQFRPADTRSPGQARMTARAVNHQRSGDLADTESELKRRDAA